MQFLVGLNDSYSQVKGQILLMEPLLLINKVFSLIVQEERQRDIVSLQSHSPETIAFFTRGQASPTPQNFTNKFNPKPYVQKKERPTCSHCGFTGHTVDKCYKLHGYPLGYQPRIKSSTSARSAHHVSSDLSSFDESASVPFTRAQCQ